MDEWVLTLSSDHEVNGFYFLISVKHYKMLKNNYKTLSSLLRRWPKEHAQRYCTCECKYGSTTRAGYVVGKLNMRRILMNGILFSH